MVGGLDQLRAQLVGLLSSRPTLHRYILLIACAAAIACTEHRNDTIDSARADSIARATQDSVNRTLPGYVVDSIRPVEEELRRFRAAIGGDSVATLSGGAASRAALVRQFVEALAKPDTVKLRRMMLTPREFSDLLYPESPYVRPPYRQAPGLVWSQIEASGSTGLTRLTRRLGGQSLRYESHECVGAAESHGSIKIWRGCTVHIQTASGEAASGRLFGSIVESRGHFKFVNYANDF